MSTEDVIRGMRKEGMPITRDNYIRRNWAGLDVSNWSALDEDELPEDLQNWSLFEARGDRLVYIGPPIET